MTTSNSSHYSTPPIPNRSELRDMILWYTTPAWWRWQTRWSWFDATTTVPGQAGLYWKPANVTLPLVIPARPPRTVPDIAVTVNGPDGAWQRCVVPVASFEDLMAAGRYVEDLDRWAAREQQRVGFQPAVRQYG